MCTSIPSQLNKDKLCAFSDQMSAFRSASFKILIVKLSLKSRDVSRRNVEQDQSCDKREEKFGKSMKGHDDAKESFMKTGKDSSDSETHGLKRKSNRQNQPDTVDETKDDTEM